MKHRTASPALALALFCVVSCTEDAGEPYITLLGPMSGATVSGDFQVEVDFSCGGRPLCEVDIFLDDDLWRMTDADSIEGGRIECDSTSRPNGDHDLRAQLVYEGSDGGYERIDTNTVTITISN